MKRLNPDVFGLLFIGALLCAFAVTLSNLVAYHEHISNPISRAELLTDPVEITKELAHAEQATTKLINTATFGVPTTFIQFRDLLKDLKEHMAQASSMSDRNVLELRNEIQGLSEPRFEFLLIEVFTFKWLLVAVLIAITIVLELRENRRRSTSGRI